MSGSLIEALDGFAAGFPGQLDALWADVLVLAQRVLASSDEERTLTWHHLVMAVGNFKRQSPIHAFRGLVRIEAPPQTNRTLLLPNGDSLRCDDSDTWPKLEGSGIRLATATAILAALWPDRHAIMDRHTRTATVALVGVTREWEGTMPVGDPDSHERVPNDWATYDWYRGKLLSSLGDDTATATRPPRHLERGLFEMHRRFWDEHPEAHDSVWREYGSRLLEFALAGLRS